MRDNIIEVAFMQFPHARCTPLSVHISLEFQGLSVVREEGRRGGG